MAYGKRSIIFLIIIATLSAVSFADANISTCIETRNITCDSGFDCLAVNVSIIPTEGSDNFFVGDYFHYKISLYGMSNETLVRNFTVYVYNPKNESLNSRLYQNILFNYSVPATLYPNLTNSENDIYAFDVLGIYRIEIIPENPKTQFYRFYPTSGCAYIHYPQKFVYSFDIMSKWQYEWNHKVSEYQNESLHLAKDVLTLSNSTGALNARMEQLTVALLFLAFVPVAITIWGAARNHWNKILGCEGLILSTLGFFQTYLSWATSEMNFITIIVSIYVMIASYATLYNKTSGTWSYVRRPFAFAMYLVSAVVVVMFLSIFQTNILVSTIGILAAIIAFGSSLIGISQNTEETNPPPEIG